MGITTIPIELYKILEEKLGREQATEVVNLYEQTAETIHTSVKISLKEELKNELATKEDIANVKAELIKWMFIFWLGQIGVLSGIIFAMLKLYFK